MIIDISIIDIVEVGRVRRRRTVRRSTGVGGKAPHLAINFRFRIYFDRFDWKKAVMINQYQTGAQEPSCRFKGGQGEGGA